MTLTRLFIALAAAFLISVIQPAQAQGWQLVDADTISTDSYLILTVPLDAPEVLVSVVRVFGTNGGLN